MPCDVVKLPGGGVAFIKRSRRARCAYPGCTREHAVLCDRPVPGQGRACDRKCCRLHAKTIAADVDWCWLCAVEEAKRGNAGKLAL
jgi:hypothetical protein